MHHVLLWVEHLHEKDLGKLDERGDLARQVKEFVAPQFKVYLEGLSEPCVPVSIISQPARF